MPYRFGPGTGSDGSNRSEWKGQATYVALGGGRQRLTARPTYRASLGGGEPDVGSDHDERKALLAHGCGTC